MFGSDVLFLYAIAMDKLIVWCKIREEWRNWLLEHFQSEKEAWLVFPTMAAHEQGVSYNDAVEEALCFGWIDGVAGTLDPTHQLRRFTPRRKGSPYSQLNIERLIYLDAHNMLHESVRDKAKEVIKKPFKFPKDIIAAIRKDKVAWANYQSFPDSYKRIRVAYIEAARKRPEEFVKRLGNFIEKTRQGKIITGYGGTDLYYGR